MVGWVCDCYGICVAASVLRQVIQCLRFHSHFVCMFTLSFPERSCMKVECPNVKDCLYWPYSFLILYTEISSCGDVRRVMLTVIL